MDVCSKCGSPVRSQARFCPHCGNQVERKPVIVDVEVIYPRQEGQAGASPSPPDGVANFIAPEAASPVASPPPEEMVSPVVLPPPEAVADPVPPPPAVAASASD